jgi:hypothetical protein
MSSVKMTSVCKRFADDKEVGDKCGHWPCNTPTRESFDCRVIEVEVHAHEWRRTDQGDRECRTCGAWAVGGIHV